VVDPGEGADLGMSKAELARRVNRNASSVRRLFTAGRVRPELPLVVALTGALDAGLRVVLRAAEAHRVTGEPGRRRRVAATGLALADYGRPHAPRERGRGRATRPAGTVTCSCRGRSIYYLASDGTVPALEFLDACPGAVDAQFTAVLDAVVAASPPRFSDGQIGGHAGLMGGWYERSG
jgi:hypothetical protein